MHLSENPKVNAAGNLALAFLLGMLVIVLGSAVVIAMQFGTDLFERAGWAQGFVNHTSMLILSFLLILVFTRGRPGGYGFRWPEKWPLLGIAGWGLGPGLISAAVHSLGPGEGLTFVAEQSFAETVIFVWIWASICEEVFTRGLLQGFLGEFSERGVRIRGTFISVPVIFGAVFFGAMHLMLFTMGVDAFTVWAIVVFAVVIGTAAGYYCQGTGSLAPAILVHMLANVGGSIGVIVGLLA